VKNQPAALPFRVRIAAKRAFGLLEQVSSSTETAAPDAAIAPVELRRPLKTIEEMATKPEETIQ
jgi:hypothetical protein